MSEDPRDALLEVARDIVAKRGYLGLTMRTASAAAGITPEVARRYYRNRDSLFAAAMRLPADPVSAIPALMAPGIEGLGERLVRFTLDTLKDPEARKDLMSLARTGVHAGHAVTGLQEFIEVGVVDRVAGVIGVPDARMRSALITSYLMGVAIMRYGVRLEPLASASDEEVIRMVAPVIQDLLDPRRPIPGSARARAEGTAASDASHAPGPPPTRTFDPDPAATRARRAAELAQEVERLRDRQEAGGAPEGSRAGSATSPRPTSAGSDASSGSAPTAARPSTGSGAGARSKAGAASSSPSGASSTSPRSTSAAGSTSGRAAHTGGDTAGATKARPAAKARPPAKAQPKSATARPKATKDAGSTQPGRGDAPPKHAKSPPDEVDDGGVS